MTALLGALLLLAGISGIPFAAVADEHFIKL